MTKHIYKNIHSHSLGIVQTNWFQPYKPMVCVHTRGWVEKKKNNIFWDSKPTQERKPIKVSQ